MGEAASGREAIAQVKRLKPHVAILDVTMPELDGLEATREIREASPETKVLILTMHESKQMLRRVLEAGASGYVLKSDFPRSLINAVKGVSQDKRFFSPNVTQVVLNGFLESCEAPAEIPSAGASVRKPTEREVQVIRLLVAGKTHKEIAVELGMSVRTVETHRAKIMLKLGLTSLSQLIQYAVLNGLVTSA